MPTVIRLALSLLLLGAGLWGAGFVLHRAPSPFAAVAATGVALAALAGLYGVWAQAPRLPLGFAVLLVALLGWWASLTPSHQRNWIPELARLPSIARDGETLTVGNHRAFRWRGESDFDAIWDTRRFDLAKLTGADVFMTYWSGEAIAHMIVSFGFADTAPLALSIEVRREQGEDWSALAGFFRTYEMAYVAADERDLIGLRTHARGEDVRLFRLRATPEQARDVLLAYAADINRLAATPRWYDTLTTNCTTVVYGLVSTLAPGWRFSLPLDPRVLLSGYLPGYLRAIGAVRQDLPLDELVRLSRISERARALSLDDPDFSARIREGVPVGRP